MSGFRLVAAVGLALATGACAVDLGGFAFVNDRSTSTRISNRPALLEPDGTCGADVNVDPSTVGGATAIAPGIGECELVRLKGEPPLDVLIGESGRGEREVQVLYQGPEGREIYLFIDNKLQRIIRPGQGDPGQR